LNPLFRPGFSLSWANCSVGVRSAVSAARRRRRAAATYTPAAGRLATEGRAAPSRQQQAHGLVRHSRRTAARAHTRSRRRRAGWQRGRATAGARSPPVGTGMGYEKLRHVPCACALLVTLHHRERLHNNHHRRWMAWRGQGRGGPHATRVRPMTRGPRRALGEPRAVLSAPLSTECLPARPGARRLGH
jgi:hypothetical protein